MVIWRSLRAVIFPSLCMIYLKDGKRKKPKCCLSLSWDDLSLFFYPIRQFHCLVIIIYNISANQGFLESSVSARRVVLDDQTPIVLSIGQCLFQRGNELKSHLGVLTYLASDKDARLLLLTHVLLQYRDNTPREKMLAARSLQLLQAMWFGVRKVSSVVILWAESLPNSASLSND